MEVFNRGGKIAAAKWILGRHSKFRATSAQWDWWDDVERRPVGWRMAYHHFHKSCNVEQNLWKFIRGWHGVDSGVWLVFDDDSNDSVVNSSEVRVTCLLAWWGISTLQHNLWNKRAQRWSQKACEFILHKFTNRLTWILFSPLLCI